DERTRQRRIEDVRVFGEPEAQRLALSDRARQHRSGEQRADDPPVVHGFLLGMGGEWNDISAIVARDGTAWGRAVAWAAPRAKCRLQPLESRVWAGGRRQRRHGRCDLPPEVACGRVRAVGEKRRVFFGAPRSRVGAAGAEAATRRWIKR